MQANVVHAVFRRDFARSFASPTAYVFITIFVFLCALAAFWSPAFFHRNLANLDLLNQWFPLLLLFLAPAITMGAWAEERRSGAEELLLTLPASDWDLVVGKFLAAVAIYTVALALAVAGEAGVLLYLGRPDPGLLAATALGHWLAGVSLVGVGMFASALTRNLTVAFILGSVLCGVVVGAGYLDRLAPGTVAGELASLVSLQERLKDLGRGVVSLDAIAYFALLAGVGLWLNHFVIGRRRRAGAPGSRGASALAGVRFVAILVACGAVLSMLGRAPVRADMTAEGLWRLTPQTRSLVDGISAERPVLITAFVSPEVPPAYAQTRETLLGLLGELDKAAGGDRIAVRIVETEPFSEAAREAEQAFAITARNVPPDPNDPESGAPAVFLGVAVASGPEQSVIPFLARGLPVEYELARAIRTVSAAEKRKVGVMETDAGWFGSFNFQTYMPERDWPILDELRKQYEVVRVSRTGPIPADLDALIVPQPSSLSDAEMTPLLEHLRSGRPALLFEDPLSLFKAGIGTYDSREAQRSPFDQSQPPPAPKADLTGFWSVLGLKPAARQVVWDAHNPRPALGDLPREFVFVGRTSGAAEPFSESDPVTSGLQEVVLMCAGLITPADREAGAAGTTVTPLLRASPASGYVATHEVVQRTVFGPSGFNPARRFVPLAATAEGGPTLAARITGPAGPIDPDDPGNAEAPAGADLNVIYIADLDMVSEAFFQMREEGYEDFSFDNVTLVLNAVDSLVGDESLVDLRKRRPAHRTLERLDARRLEQQQATLAAIDGANAAAEKELADARARMNEKVAELEGREDLDDNTRAIMIESVRRAEQRRVDVRSAAIEDEKQRRIEEARAKARREIDGIEMSIRAAAVAIPPIPAFLLGCAVFVRRRAREHEGVSRERLRP